MIHGFTISGHRTEFCEKPDGTVTSQHEFKLVPGTIRQDHDFEYALFACVCKQTLQGSRVAKRVAS